jgi:Leucine-rich repeat (LRR) protein
VSVTVFPIHPDYPTNTSGITHLLLSRCGTELVQILPSLLAVLAPTLVVLDISHNAFTVLPDELRQCLSLEELNVSTNPLRSIPPFIGGLFSLRQLQVDQCTLQALPVEMQNLASLHTLCGEFTSILDGETGMLT